MVSKVVFLFLILVSACGREVDISSAKLKNASETSALKAMKEGVLHSGSPNKIQYNSQSYEVSRYSSHLALQFIKTIPKGKQIEVKFEGDIKESEIVLSKIENN